jgi:hypothetical protein
MLLTDKATNKRRNKMKSAKTIQAIKEKADRVITYLSEEYVALPDLAKRFAEVHLLHNGYYTCTLTASNEKVFIQR